MPTKKIVYTWIQFIRDCWKLARKVPRVDAIVALVGDSVGGMLLAAMLVLFTKNRHIYVISYEHEEKGGAFTIRTIVPVHPKLSYKHALLCADMLRSGVVYMRAMEDLNMHHNLVTKVCLHVHEDSLIIPEFCANPNKVKVKVNYPWGRR